MSSLSCAILRLLLETDEQVSGGRLSRELGVTRSAIWKKLPNFAGMATALTQPPQKATASFSVRTCWMRPH